jgi:hypothetical protein
MALDLSAISRFCVIRIPFKFSGQTFEERKRFVALGHFNNHAICLKATSKVAIYQNNPEKMAGCVYYGSGETALFERDTAIQPDNQIPIHHDQLENALIAGTLEIMGTLPLDFEAKLRVAIENSTTLDDRRRSRLIALLNC